MRLELKCFSVLIDDEDLETIRPFSWSVSIACGKPYARTTALMHRMVVKPPKGMMVDHADLNKLNNTRENLRICNNSQNLANRYMEKGNRSGYKGVTKFEGHAKGRPWVAQLAGKNLGYFASPEEASAAYKSAAIGKYGPFARSGETATKTPSHCSSIMVGSKKVFVDREDVKLLSFYSWYIAKKGYAATSIQMHRLIMNCPPDKVVDHINGDTLNNMKTNLRICSPSENGGNRRLNINNSTGYRGVWFNARSNTKPWQAQIKQDGQVIALGTFATAEEAALTYDTAAHSFFGQFARLNFPVRIP
jgi:hypothetical protein